MSVESSPNKREEWDAQANETQAAINELIAKLAPEIREVNQQISDFCDRRQFDLANRLVAESLDYFNKQWVYKGDRFYVSGAVYTATMTPTTEGIIMGHEQTLVTLPMQSLGFIGKQYSDSPDIVKIRIGYAFLYAKEMPVATIYGHGSMQPHAYADIDDDFSLLYLRPNGEDVVSGDEEQIRDRIERAKALTHLYLHDPRSSFYDASARKQQQFFMGTTQFVEEALPNPDTADHLSVQTATDNITWKTTEGSLQSMHSTNPDLLYEVIGTALGATSRNILPDDQLHAFRSPEDLVDAKGDICLIVEPQGANFPIPPKLSQHPKDTQYEFIVPVTSAEKFETKLV